MVFFSHGSGHSCGVAVLVRKYLDFKLKSFQADEKGRFISIRIEKLSIYRSNILKAGFLAVADLYDKHGNPNIAKYPCTSRLSTVENYFIMCLFKRHSTRMAEKNNLERVSEKIYLL